MNKTAVTKELIHLSDLGLVVFLSLNHLIERIDSDPNNHHRSVFTFAKSPEIEQQIDQYYRNTVSVEPQLYFNQIRAVKARIPR